MNGILNLYKEKGYTSHDCVAVCRRLFGAKAGHAGTLDPNAEGVLPMCLGSATRLSDYLSRGTKDYRAVVLFGAATDTQDETGSVIITKAVTAGEHEARRVLASFLGEHEQTPPMYSAVKVGGKKLYELARAGKEIERKPRLVRFDALCADWRGYPNSIILDVTCAKGTYIRTLCDDLGKALGGSAHMGDLTRLRVGRLLADNAVRVGELREAGPDVWKYVQTPQEALPDFGVALCVGNTAKTVANGGKIGVSDINVEKEASGGEVMYFLMNETRVCALYERSGDMLAPRAVFPI